MSRLFHRRISSPRARRAGHRPQVEALEPRVALSLGSEFGIATSGANEFGSANASSTNGMSVAVWVQHVRTSGGRSLDKIDAQVYSASGSRVGGVIVVNGAENTDSQPAVAMDRFGSFIAVYTHTFSNGDQDIYGSVFNASGRRLRNVTIASTNRPEFEPSVALAANGDYVVAYTVQYSSSDQDVVAKMFTGSFSLIRTINVANTSTFDEHHPSVARTPDGRFAVAYQSDRNGSNPDIVLKRYSATGSLVNTHAIANTAAPEYYPKVAIDDRGNSVVTWYAIVGGDRDVFARRVSSTGVMGAPITIANTTADELFPAVAVNRTGGSFVVAYTVGLTNPRLMVKEVSASNVIRATYNAGSPRHGAALSIDGNNYFFLTYTKDFSSTDQDIVGRFGHLA